MTSLITRSPRPPHSKIPCSHPIIRLHNSIFEPHTSPPSHIPGCASPYFDPSLSRNRRVARGLENHRIRRAADGKELDICGRGWIIECKREREREREVNIGKNWRGGGAGASPPLVRFRGGCALNELNKSHRACRFIISSMRIHYEKVTICYFVCENWNLWQKQTQKSTLLSTTKIIYSI